MSQAAQATFSLHGPYAQYAAPSRLTSFHTSFTIRRLRRALGIALDQQLPLFLEWNKKIVTKFTPIFEDLLKLLPATIVHSFEGSEDEARKLLDKGFYLGISCRCGTLPVQSSLCLLTECSEEFLQWVSKVWAFTSYLG